MTVSRLLKTRLAIGTAALLAPATPLLAQTVPTAPIAPPTRSEIERLPAAPRATRPGRLTIDGGIERAPCPLDAPRFAAVTVKLDRVVFDGLEGVDAGDLEAASAGYAGRTVPIAAICEIRDAAATILRARGYLAAVQVPPQRIDAGTVHLSVLMAHLVAVHVRGDAGHAENLIAGYLEPLKDGKPFNQHRAERALLLAGDLPGFDIHLTLRPAGTGEPGAVVGDVTVSRVPFAADVDIQNLGSSAIGRWSGLINVEANDLLGAGDRIVLGYYNTFDVREQKVAQASYEVRPGNQGLTIAGRFTYATTRPGIGGGDPVRARTLIGTGEVTYPVIRRQAETLRVAGGLDVVDQRLRFAGLPFTNDQLRVLYGRVDFNAIDVPPATLTGLGTTESRWRASGALELRHGLAALGASSACGPAPFYAGCAGVPSISRIDADPQATLVRLTASLSVTPVPAVTVVISPRAQVAFDPLLSFEQFAVGNYTIGRGYDPGVLTGDSGFGAQTEVRLRPIVRPAWAGVAVQPFAFVDLARTWLRGVLPSVYDRQSIVSVGGGARLSLRDRGLLEVFLAKPLVAPPLGGSGKGLRLLVNLTAHFAAAAR